jgi:hypothetical protein
MGFFSVDCCEVRASTTSTKRKSKQKLSVIHQHNTMITKNLQIEREKRRNENLQRKEIRVCVLRWDSVCRSFSSEVCQRRGNVSNVWPKYTNYQFPFDQSVCQFQKQEDLKKRNKHKHKHITS